MGVHGAGVGFSFPRGSWRSEEGRAGAVSVSASVEGFGVFVGGEGVFFAFGWWVFEVIVVWFCFRCVYGCWAVA